jgi:hypothetical protein
MRRSKSSNGIRNRVFTFHEDESKNPYFDNGLFRTASGTVLRRHKREKDELEFREALSCADVEPNDLLRKVAFLMANFGNVRRLKEAFRHGAGTGGDYFDWKGDGGFTDEEVSRIRQFMLRGLHVESKVHRDKACVLI